MHLGGVLDRAVRRRGADQKVAIVGADVREPGQPLHVNQAFHAQEAFLEDQE